MQTHNTMPKLSPNEMAIMTALWDLEHATGKQLLDRLSPALAHTTLLTYLSRLQGKGYVTREPSEQGYVYSAAVPRTAVAGRLIDQAVEQFEGSFSSLVSHFVQTRPLSAEERQRLREVLDGLEEPNP